MKHPLYVSNSTHGVTICDSDGRVVCLLYEAPRNRELAEFIVKKANSWRWLRSWFRPYTREDWLWERNTARINKR